jgi:hypothetical protein
MNRFLSTKNGLIQVILWSLVAILTGLLITSIMTSTPIPFVPKLILGLVIGLIIWILLDTRYVIKTKFLLYRSGPFRGRIDINETSFGHQWIYHYLQSVRRRICFAQQQFYFFRGIEEN